MSLGFRVAADIGGTFTDLVLSSEAGHYATRKVLSTPDDHGRAVVEGLLAMTRELGIAPGDVEEICHATTVATNSVLERHGPRTGLLTTRGFRDVLELRRMRFPDTYNLFWEKPVPLVERRLRLEVDERMGAKGEVVQALDEVQALAAIGRLVEEEQVESIAVALINAPANPAHEQALGRLVAQHFPRVFVSLSSDVLPQLREYERTSTTVLNAYLGPTMSRYLGDMAAALRERGFKAPVYVMHSGGGIMSVESAIRYPVSVLESGPAAGIVGAAALVDSDQPAAVTFDMGGTTAKAALIENGKAFKAHEFEVGAPISIASRVLKGGGYLVRVPAIDVAEVGAGGGSIAALDPGGALAVGPRSAGASPGPACYGLGGTEPTVTDANLLLGLLNDQGLAGGDMPLDRGNARRALEGLAAAAGQSPLDLAHGIRAVAVYTMARAVHSVSTQRGRDVRRMSMVAFGGNGPLHAAALAEKLGITRVRVPPSAGVFSALGLLCSDNERSFVRVFNADLHAVDPQALAQAFDGPVNDAREAVRGDRPGAQVSLSWFADLRYRGQTFELRIALGEPGTQSPDQIRAAFEAEYRRTYGHDQPQARVQVVNVGCIASARVQRPRLPDAGNGKEDAPHQREVYFSPAQAAVKVPVLRSRAAVGTGWRAGPLLIDEYDATTVVPPGWSVRAEGGHLLLEREGTA